MDLGCSAARRQHKLAWALSRIVGLRSWDAGAKKLGSLPSELPGENMDFSRHDGGGHLDLDRSGHGELQDDATALRGKTEFEGLLRVQDRSWSEGRCDGGDDRWEGKSRDVIPRKGRAEIVARVPARFTK
jgi:hypothetical protein